MSSSMSTATDPDGLLGAFADKRNASELAHVAENDRRFAVEARRDRMLAHWAEPLLGRSVGTYFSELVSADLTGPGEGDVVAKLLADLAAAGHSIPEEEIRRLMVRFEALALRGVLQEESGQEEAGLEKAG